jgi:SAM-dependent methyltransferase
MALLKVLRHARRYGISSVIGKVAAEFPAYLCKFYLWRIRRCACCERLTIFLCNGSAEFRACVFCSANERYELLAAEIKSRYGSKLAEMDVLELDPYSPLRKILSRARKHVRTFYEPMEERGSFRRDGTMCQDITQLAFPDESFDLIVSSDVLEHVPLLADAFRETCRVLKPEGAHLFTVPPRLETKRRAELVEGRVLHLAPPEYHRDPLSPEGILAYWDMGPDLGEMFSSDSLRFSVVRGPVGADKRTVWMAQRSRSSDSKE